jgi:transposase
MQPLSLTSAGRNSPRFGSRQRQKGGICTGVITSLENHIRFLDEEIARLQRQINDHVSKHPDLKEQVDLVDSIPGIGPDTAAQLVAEIKTIDGFDNASELAAYAGLTPMHRRSGSSVRHRPKLSKIGNAHLRKALFFPAMTAMRHNPAAKALRDRLAQRGKPKMLILGAAMRRLLHIVYGVLKHRRPFDLAAASFQSPAQT